MRWRSKESERVLKEKEGYIQVIIDAHDADMSVLEMSRITGSNNADFFYQTLRNSGRISPMKRGRTPRIDLPASLNAIFPFKGISFPKWCHTWQFEIEEARKALSVEVPSDMDRAFLVHWALRRDFPEWYDQNYPLSLDIRNITPMRYQQGLWPSMQQVRASICWETEHNRYIARIDGLEDQEGLFGSGRKFKTAISELEHIWMFRCGGVRLSHAIQTLREDDPLPVLG